MVFIYILYQFRVIHFLECIVRAIIAIPYSALLVWNMVVFSSLSLSEWSTHDTHKLSLNTMTCLYLGTDLDTHTIYVCWSFIYPFNLWSCKVVISLALWWSKKSHYHYIRSTIPCLNSYRIPSHTLFRMVDLIGYPNTSDTSILEIHLGM